MLWAIALSEATVAGGREAEEITGRGVGVVMAVSPFQGIVFAGHVYPGRRCALPWAEMFLPRWGEVCGGRVGREETIRCERMGASTGNLLMAGAFDIRVFAASDRDGVVTLWREVFPDAPAWNDPATVINRKLGVQPEMFLVATVGRSIVGTAMAGDDGHRGWVHLVPVSPAHRRQRIGTALMRRVEEALARAGCPKLNLQVRASNPSAINFYEKLGYEVEDRVSMAKDFDSSQDSRLTFDTRPPRHFR